MFIDSNTLVLNSMVLKLADLMPQLAPEFKIAQIAPDHAALVLAAQSAVCVLLASKPSAPLLAERVTADPLAGTLSPTPAPVVEPDAPNEDGAGRHAQRRTSKRVAKVKRQPKAHRAVTARASKSAGKKMLKCPHCTEEFKSDGWRMRHMLKVHGTMTDQLPTESASL